MGTGLNGMYTGEINLADQKKLIGEKTGGPSGGSGTDATKFAGSSGPGNKPEELVIDGAGNDYAGENVNDS